MTNLQQYYKKTSANDLVNKLNINSIHEIPKIEKIVINISFKEGLNEKTRWFPVLLALQIITGNKYVIRKAKESISSFKLRKNASIGCKIVLTNRLLYSFLENLTQVGLPRMKFFKGFSNKTFDQQGNFSFSLKDTNVFPELEEQIGLYEDFTAFNVTIVTSCTSILESKILLSSLQIPFIAK